MVRLSFTVSGAVGVALILYVAAIVGIALLFTYFSSPGNCPAPDTILSITLILVVFATLSQLFVSKDANLLTSSVSSGIWYTWHPQQSRRTR